MISVLFLDIDAEEEEEEDDLSFNNFIFLLLLLSVSSDSLFFSAKRLISSSLSPIHIYTYIHIYILHVYTSRILQKYICIHIYICKCTFRINTGFVSLTLELILILYRSIEAFISISTCIYMLENK
jgi:hypothetical protein